MEKNLNKLHNPNVNPEWKCSGATKQAAALRFKISNNSTTETTSRKILASGCFNANPWVYSNLRTLAQVIWNSHEELRMINWREIEGGETGNHAKS